MLAISGDDRQLPLLTAAEEEERRSGTPDVPATPSRYSQTVRVAAVRGHTHLNSAPNIHNPDTAASYWDLPFNRQGSVAGASCLSNDLPSACSVLTY